MLDLLAEIRSWANWIFRYHLPCWVSALFRYSVFRILYFLLVGTLFLVYIPIGVIRELMRQVLIGEWAKLVGENSLDALNNLLNSFSSKWIIPALVFLILWGSVVWIWGWKQQGFFKSLSDLGINIVRGPGKRFPFLKRLQEAGVTALGLGPSAKLLEIYLPCHEDQILREKLLALFKDRTDLGLIITGPATSGKTRIAMELIARTQVPLVFIWPRTLESRIWSNIPAWKGTAVLFADNLVPSQTGGEIPISAYLQEFLQRCQNIILIGTIRKKQFPEEHKMLDVVELSKTEREVLSGLASEVAKIESGVRKIKVDANTVMNRYNGYPASLVAGLDAMRDIYHGLDLETRSTLQAIRVLWEMGVHQLTVGRVWEVTELITGSEIAASRRTQILEALGIYGFIATNKDGQS